MRAQKVRPEDLARHLEQRRQQSERIRSAPEEFKVCYRCASIAYKHSALCPICGCYRWLESTDAVRLVAEFSGRFPFPFSAGTVPRLGGGERLKGCPRFMIDQR